MRTLMIGLVLVLTAACGNNGGICNLKADPQESSCDPGITPDPKANSCKDSMGVQYICRSGLGFCVKCTGGSYNDGCTITNNGTDSYCVHDCSDC